MSSRLDELRRKKEELIRKKEEQKAQLQKEQQQAQQAEPLLTPTRLQPSAMADGGKEPLKGQTKFPINPSPEVVLLSQKQETKPIVFEVGVTANAEDQQRFLEDEDKYSESSEDEVVAERPVTKFDELTANIRAANQRLSTIKPPQENGLHYLSQEQADNIFLTHEASLMTFFKRVENMLEKELNQKGKDDLIEDYIYNQDKDIREQKEGCTVKKIEDPEIENKYMVNDLVWMKSNLYETEKIAACYSKLQGIRETSFDKHDYLIGVYSNERRVETKSSRAEIKKICADDQEDTKIIGGLDNGRVAIWDLRTEKLPPDLISKISEKANYLPIIDIKKRAEDIFTVGLEGRICKWDARKFEEPVFYFDLLCVAEGNSIAQLEAMPMSMEIDPVDKDVIYVTTFEGSVYELAVNPNNFQQRNFLPDLHTAPITRLKVMDFKSFFKDPVISKRNSVNINPNAKYVNHLLTCSFDWSIKLFKGSLANEIHTFRYHNDFVTNIDVSNGLCPFTFASADAEGKLAVWKVDSNNLDLPMFEWSNSSAISKIAWNMSGVKLAVGDVKGGINTLSFPKNKLLVPEKAFLNYLSSGLSNLKKS